MAKNKTLGFFDFHITADKTMDFLLKNGFTSNNLAVTAVKAGEQFAEAADASKKPEENEAEKMTDNHTIIDFFKQLFHFEDKPIASAQPYVADRDGFILTVLTTGIEQTQVAEESLANHGAYFVKAM